MKKEYIQKGLFSSKTYTITKTGVDIKEKSIFNYHEHSIDFTDFTTKMIIKKDTNTGLLFFVFMFGLATIVIFLIAILNKDKGYGSTFTFLFLFLSFLSIALLTKKKVIILPTYYGSKSLEITFKKSTEKEARNFADLLISETKRYLITKFTKVDKDLPIERQLDDLLSLRDRDLIDESEFTRLKNILLDKDQDTKIGFN